MNKKAYTYEESQELLIKALIAQQSSIPIVSEEISSEDFSNDKYKEIYKAILELYSSNITITEAELFKFLKYERGIGLLEQDLLLFTQPPLDAPITLAGILKYNSVTDKAIKISNDTANDLLETSTPLETIGKLQKEMTELSFRLTNENRKTMKDEVSELEEYILKDEGEEVYTIPSPYETLNKYLEGGFKPEKLITIGARTGIGKTVVATQSTALACAMGKSVLYFSLEMSNKELIKRLMACNGNIMLRHLSPSPDRAETVITRIKETGSEIKNWKLKIVDDTDVTVEKIRSISQQTAQSEVGLDMIIIDYLQLISTKGMQGRSRQEFVAEISRNCKMMAKELGVPVMVLVQLNRESKDESEDRLPSKADIRESGAIAADSDVIIILHRKNRDSSNDPKAMIILDKNRGGPSDKKFMLRCVLEKNIFQDLKDENGSFTESYADKIKEKSDDESSENVIEEFGDISDTFSEWGNNDSEEIDYDDLFN